MLCSRFLCSWATLASKQEFIRFAGLQAVGIWQGCCGMVRVRYVYDDVSSVLTSSCSSPNL